MNDGSKINSSLSIDEVLRPFSKEHHYNLLCSWKIRKGLENDIETQRIKNYVVWFYENYARRHFEAEEKYIFPILGKDHPIVKKSLSRHRRLKRLFKDTKNIYRSLNQLEEELEQHIRFEDRELFKEVQRLASESELKNIEEQKKKIRFIENEKDKFWE